MRQKSSTPTAPKTFFKGSYLMNDTTISIGSCIFLCICRRNVWQALRDLSHKHVIRMLDVVTHPKFVCFVMEFASKGDLRGHLNSQGRLSEDSAKPSEMLLPTVVQITKYL